MKKKTDKDIFKATKEERRLIAELTAKPLFERLDAGEVEQVSFDDWSDVPEPDVPGILHVPMDLYEKIASVSRRRHTTPDRLASRWLAERVKTV